MPSPPEPEEDKAQQPITLRTEAGRRPFPTYFDSKHVVLVTDPSNSHCIIGTPVMTYPTNASLQEQHRCTPENYRTRQVDNTSRPVPLGFPMIFGGALVPSNLRIV